MLILKKTKYIALPLLLILLLAVYLLKSEHKTIDYTADNRFKSYWYGGLAEITSYKLQQARYGEIHSGEAVLIYVTEDFLADKQVKYETGNAEEQIKKIIKLNSTRKFYTGIYPYSIMNSVFTPVDPNSSTIKVTSSSQEWCGHTFMQLNNRRNRYQIEVRSYFQSEADQNLELAHTMLEDELWTKLRLDPQLLPLGETELVPGFHYLRLRHRQVKAEPVVIRMFEPEEGQNAGHSAYFVYDIKYKNINRNLKIKFENKFPYYILGWEETYQSGSGRGKQFLSTTATRINTINLDYWRKNSAADSTYRQMLNINQ